MPKKRYESAVAGELASDKTCCFNDMGHVCRAQGVLSPGDKGSGPWYCREHAWVFLGGERKPAPMPTRNVSAEAEQYCSAHGLKTVAQMRQFIKTGMQGMSAKPGNLDWARRIMTNHADSKNVPMLSLSKAREALGIE